MPQIPGRLITYCSNIHPAETWAATFAALRRHIPAIKAAVASGHSFPIGLRLSSRAAAELTMEQNTLFRAWLEEQDCFVPTLNGFPFGAFHGEGIKERVYLPDWRSPERADYSIRLAELLVDWLPEGMTGSISTVPLGFKGLVGTRDYPEILRRLESVLTHLARLYDRRGKRILLALEPEPGCLLETTEEVCRFFDTIPFSAELGRHLGICYDSCHQAVGFEDPEASWNLLAAAGVPIAKVQVSSALRVDGERSDRLMRFNEPCYLHQVVVRRRRGELLRYSDLPAAASGHAPHPGDEWRCHFHVPISHGGTEDIGATQAFLKRLLPLIPPEILLEVETYTWSVLPADLRGATMTESIIGEIEWLKESLRA